MTQAGEHQARSARTRRAAIFVAAGVAGVAGATTVVLAGADRTQPFAPPTSIVTTWSPAPPPTSTVITTPAALAATSSTIAVEPPLEPPPDTLPPTPDALATLTPAQAADPEALAAHFLVTYASFGAHEDPAAFDARLAQFTTPLLAEELRRNSSASAALEDLRAGNVAFGGEVVEISVSERSHSRAIVVAVVEHTTAVAGAVDPEFDLVPYTVTLVASGPGWLVAGLTQ